MTELWHKKIMKLQDPKEMEMGQSKLAQKDFLDTIRGVYTPLRYLTFTHKTILADWKGKRVMRLFMEGRFVPFSAPTRRFVVKPDYCCGGEGVIVLDRAGEQRYKTPTGVIVTEKELSEHINKYVIQPTSTYLREDNKPVFAEVYVEPYEEIKKWSPYGTPTDFRLFFGKKEFLYGRARIPTRKSKGYGNGCNGAFVVTFDKTGTIYDSPLWLDGSYPDFCGALHPETMEDWTGRDIPRAKHMISVGRTVSSHCKSPLVCVDGMLDTNGVFKVVELTFFPGTLYGPDMEDLYKRLI